MSQLSYRQVKRLSRCSQQKGSKGLRHGHVGEFPIVAAPGRYRPATTRNTTLKMNRDISARP
jgi:hypothetical protein